MSYPSYLSLIASTAHLQSQSRNRQNLSTDEYYCPLCRQLADVILPILPTGSDTPMIVVPPDDPLQCIKDIGAMLQQKPALWVSLISIILLCSG